MTPGMSGIRGGSERALAVLASSAENSVAECIMIKRLVILSNRGE